MSDCTKCIHEQACNTWMRYLHSIYDDHSYSTEGCPDYIPSADIVKVVRCKDCESFLRDSDLLQRHICIRWYPGSTRIVKPDDFCSYGKQKEGVE